MKQVITTVGLSIFTNYMKYQSTDIKDKFDALNEHDMTVNQWDQNEKAIKSIRKSIIAWAKNKNDASAEIKSLIKIHNKNNRVDLDNYFIATDTILSKLASELIIEVLQDRYPEWVFQPVEVIQELNVYSNNLRLIHKGYQELIRYLNNVTSYDFTYNISGGYKAIIPLMTLIASLKKVNLCYIYEDSDKLIEIPPFPFEFDINICNQFKDIFNAIDVKTAISFQDYERFITKISSDKQKVNILQSFLIKENEQITFSEIGLMIWEEWKSQQPLDLQKTSLKPNQKKISIRDDHGKDKLLEFAKKLVNSEYIIEIVNSMPFNPDDRSFIKKTFDNGKVELVLHKTDQGLGIVVQTTGRNKRETEEIAKILEKDYYA